LDLDHSDTSSAALQHALAGQTPYEFHELCVDRLPTPQGRASRQLRKKRLTRPTASPRPLALRRLVTSLCRAALGEIIFLYFKGLSWHPKPAKALYRSDPRGWSHGSDAPCGPERGRQICAPATHRKSHPCSLPHAGVQRRRSR
jgi:hypothetical protein